MRLLRGRNKIDQFCCVEEIKNGDFCCAEEIKYLYLQKKYNYDYERNYPRNYTRKPQASV